MTAGTDIETAMGTEQACRLILAQIRTDLVDTVEFDSVGAKLSDLAAMDGRLSSGEMRLRDIAQSVWSGRGGASVADLGMLDRDRFTVVLDVLQRLWGQRA